MANTLLNCPFCAGEAEILEITEGDEVANVGGSVVTCRKCGASSPVHFDRKENLVDSWNRRAALPQSQGIRALVEELRAALETFASFAYIAEVTEDGWGNNIHREPISTWFGPSDFFTARAIRARAADALSCLAGEGWRPLALTFRPAAELPDVPKGNMKAAIILMRSRHNGKNFTIPAWYLNAYPLEFEDGCGDAKCEDEHEDGCPVTGWFCDNANFEYENCYYRIEGECLAWALIPDAKAVEAALDLPAPSVEEKLP